MQQQKQQQQQGNRRIKKNKIGLKSIQLLLLRNKSCLICILTFQLHFHAFIYVYACLFIFGYTAATKNRSYLNIDFVSYPSQLTICNVLFIPWFN